MYRKILVLSLVGILFYVAGVIGLRVYRILTTPDWKANLGRPSLLEVRENRALTVQYQIDSNYINGDLLYAANWSSQEVDELLNFIDIVEISEESVKNTEQYDPVLAEMWLKRNDALSAISARFRVEAPIDEDQRQILIDRLTAGLYQNKSFKLMGSAVANVARSGLADEPGPIRDRLLYIYQHPKEFFGKYGLSLAENVKRQLKSRGTFVLEGESHGG